jgi:hypothetical protein
MFTGKADKRMMKKDVEIELRVRERRFPCFADGLIVPVASCMKMHFGAAKWARDATGGVAQFQAEQAAPLSPGDAFVGAGGKYRFENVILAVVMDMQKQTSAEWIGAGLKKALQLSAEAGNQSCIVADMTDDLLRQPQTITLEERLSTCKIVASAIFSAMIDAEATPKKIVMWVWREEYRKVWEEIFDRYSMSRDTLKAEK